VGALTFKRARLELGGAWLAETETAGFAFGLSTAQLGACFDAVRSRQLSLGSCAQLELGALHAVVRSPNLRPLLPTEHLWVALGLGPRLSLRGPALFRAELGCFLLAPVTRPEFAVVDESSARFQPARIAFSGFVGLGVMAP
jgi:hypothetical protein